MAETQINLIQREVGGMRRLTLIETSLRRVAWWLLIGVFVVGVATGVSYLVSQARIRDLESARTRIVQSINAQSVKEGLLLSLKERATIAARALDAAKPWGKLFSVLDTMASESAFNAVSLDDTGRVTATLELLSVDEALVMVTNTMQLADSRSLRSPQMHSFALKSDGSVQIILSFYPVF